MGAIFFGNRAYAKFGDFERVMRGLVQQAVVFLISGQIGLFNDYLVIQEVASGS